MYILVAVKRERMNERMKYIVHLLVLFHGKKIKQRRGQAWGLRFLIGWLGQPPSDDRHLSSIDGH